MKRRTVKLNLSRETVRTLTAGETGAAHGAATTICRNSGCLACGTNTCATCGTCSCFLSCGSCASGCCETLAVSCA